MSMTSLTTDNHSSSYFPHNVTDTGLEEATTVAGCSTIHLTSSPLLSYGSLVMGVFLIAENGLLITTICRTQSLHTNTNILVASLAVTDLVMGFTTSLIGFYVLVGGYKTWFRSNSIDQRLFDSFMVGEYMSLTSISITHMALLALDRYMFLKWPFRYAQKITKRRIIAAAATIWTIGLVYWFLPMVILQDPEYHKNCLMYNVPFYYGGGPPLIVYTVSLTIILGSTVSIAKLALDHRRRRSKNRVVRLGELSHQISSYAGGNVEVSEFGADKDIANKTSATQDGVSISSNIKPNNEVFQVQLRQARHSAHPGAKSVEIKESIASEGISQQNDNNVYIVEKEYESNNCYQGHKTKNHYLVTLERSLNKYKKNVVPQDPTIKKEEKYRAVTLLGVRHAKNINKTGGNFIFDSFGLTGEHCQVLSKSLTQKSSLANESIDRETVCNNENIIQKSPHSIDKKGTDSNKNTDSKIFSDGNKILKFIFVMFGSFLFCTFPPLLSFNVAYLTDSYHFSSQANQAMGFVLISNSAMNFFILTYMNKEFRAALFNTWLFRIFKKSCPC